MGLRTEAVASGWPSCTVIGSSLLRPASPKSFSAAICSTMAWVEILMVGTAILSFSLLSFCGLLRPDAVQITMAKHARPDLLPEDWRARCPAPRRHPGNSRRRLAGIVLGLRL